MRYSVFVELPPVDESFMTESSLAQQVLVEFAALRRAGEPQPPLCSVSSVRLQQTIRRRYPTAYEKIINEGTWRGKWHRFVETVAGLHCFQYSTSDYTAEPTLEIHIPPTELRCSLQGEDGNLVRKADAVLGAILWETLLQFDAMRQWCETVAAAAADDKNEKIFKPRWMPLIEAPSLAYFLQQLSLPKGKGFISSSIRRNAVREVVSILTREDTLAQHVSISQLRRFVTYTLGAWRAADVPMQKENPDTLSYYG
ncbi:uncharacterized protein TM35_000101680 [Trypanosoma theileri]|uniref:Uncharacterized protein n=1 Tax=Trypanosoma theileri TaxID=67003 RepID=A0A1X0P0G3_9TRYP|nr:uncharacterized protein TM35_000101680 [Trypanosoma theileri]ORC89900.1 hypothetical protein TM35_000101680 [Trypanosoma theileri]